MENNEQVMLSVEEYEKYKKYLEFTEIQTVKKNILSTDKKIQMYENKILNLVNYKKELKLKIK